MYVPVAQLDRASACGAEGRRFESCQVHHDEYPSYRWGICFNAGNLTDVCRLYLVRCACKRREVMTLSIKRIFAVEDVFLNEALSENER